ncbi:MAG: ATPase [Schleiferiaceae bacterium]|nr:ATPase [Schleiferiaceae bacterium]
MILIAESGSTKCDWVAINPDGSEHTRFSTMGFNPYFHSASFIEEELVENEAIIKLRAKIAFVYFYGAGASSEGLQDIVKDGLTKVFVNANVRVDHDLLASAYSTYTGEPAITCIIGTGSNSCYFDGNEVSEVVPALAYILGDEGSASYIGKRLVSDFLYKKLPQEMADDFFNTYQLDKDEVITSVYNKPNANVYLASFSRFAGKHMHTTYVQEIIREGFSKFADIHIACFDNCREVPVHFVGSVGSIFQDILLEVLEERGMKLGQILRKPVDGLIKYHLEYLRVLDVYQKQT